MKKKVYSKEFKQEVVDYVKSNGISINQGARKFGVSVSTLSDWIKATEEHKDEAFVGTGHLRKKSAEEKAKDKKMKDLEEENAILKKALAIFSRL